MSSRLLAGLACTTLLFSSIAGRGAPHDNFTCASDAASRTANDEGCFTQASETTVIRATPPVHRGVGRLVEELSIGTLGGPDATIFARISAVAVGTDGSIFVADAGIPAIRKFDRNGEFVRSFGRQGTGPGEYQEPTDISLMRDGTLLAYSRNGGRILAYAADGRLLWTRTETRLFGFNTTLGRPYAPLLEAARDDLIYVRYYPVSRPPRSVRTPMRLENPSTYARWRPDGTPVDTLVEPFHPIDPPFIFAGRAADPSRVRQVPFTPLFTWTLSPLGYFVSGYPVDRAGHYSFELRIPVAHAAPGAGRPPYWREGDPVRSIRVPYTAVPVSLEEQRAWQSTYTAYMREMDSRWTWNASPMPTRRPPFKLLWSDDEGRIWVMLHTAATVDTTVHPSRPGAEVNAFFPFQRWRESQQFDVVEPSGRYLGRVAAPGPIYPAAARGDTLWAYIVDYDTVPRVQRFRIVWGGVGEVTRGGYE